MKKSVKRSIRRKVAKWKHTTMTNKKSVPFHVSEWVFFLVGLSLCLCLSLFFSFSILPTIALIQGVFFSTDAETDNGDKSDMNSDHWFQHRLSLCVLHHAVGRVSSSLDWYFKWCALGFFAMQRSWSQSNRCLSRSDGNRMSYHLPVWWTGVSPFFQCLDSSSACNSRPSRDRSLHRVSHKNSALSRALCRINHRNVDFPVPPLPSIHASSKEDRTVSALNIRKHSSWKMNFCTDELPHSFSCLFARVLWSTVQDMEKYNVKISVIWCPTNRLRFHFIYCLLFLTKYELSWTVVTTPFRVFVWFSWHANAYITF